jgi:hypothetical protein
MEAASTPTLRARVTATPPMVATPNLLSTLMVLLASNWPTAVTTLTEQQILLIPPMMTPHLIAVEVGYEIRNRINVAVQLIYRPIRHLRASLQ